MMNYTEISYCLQVRSFNIVDKDYLYSKEFSRSAITKYSIKRNKRNKQGNFA